MNFASIRNNDVANGTGIRVTIFFSGCTHKCKGCFNQEYWDFNYGSVWTEKQHGYVITLLNRGYINGLSLLGGEPFDQDLKKILDLLIEVKARYPKKTIWIWSGYLYDELINRPDALDILKCTDVLVDGEFIEAQKNLKLKFRGSENQRIINVQESLKQNKVVLLEL
jgi:anaerobic ribonucleoside-triphosphate reductase activating protein